MIKLFRNRTAKVLALTMVFTMLAEIVSPTMVYALTEGPTNPEFSDFESVISTDMVNTFSGDFSYNLPVIDVPGPYGSGYSMSLSYHSGMNPEEEASWVGFGWTLNPGAINRNKRGLPDDFNAKTVTYYNKTKPNIYVSRNNILGTDYFPVSATLNGITYSNYGAFGKYWGLDYSCAFGTLGMQVSNGDPTFSMNIDPLTVLSHGIKEVKKMGKKTKGKTDDKKDANSGKQKVEVKKLEIKKDIVKNMKIGKMGSGGASFNGKIQASLSLFGSSFGLFSRGQYGHSLGVSPSYGMTFAYSNKKNIVVAEQTVARTGYVANFNVTGNVPVIEKHAYGSYYNQEGYAVSSNEQVARDYFVEKEGNYDRRLSFLGIPFNSYDNFAVSGEQLSGSFRIHHNEIGYHHPEKGESYTVSYQGGPSVDVITPVIGMGVGTTLLGGTSTTTVDDWTPNVSALGTTPKLTNDLVWSGHADNFFRFEGELHGSIDYKTATSDVLRADITSAYDNDATNLIPGARRFYPSIGGMVLNSSDDDMENTSYLPTNGASHIAESKNSDGTIKDFEIVNESGQLFKYNIPVYARRESEITIPLDGDNVPTDNYTLYKSFYMNTSLKPAVYQNASTTSSQNKYASGTYTPDQYAVQYLLTDIETPDYYDADGDNEYDATDGGGWTHFDYRKIWGASSIGNNSCTNTTTCTGCTTYDNWYRWRMPYTGFRYEKNDLSKPIDDVAFFSTGEKEVYYMSAIETKTHIAFFVTNKTKYCDLKEEYRDLITESNVRNMLNGSGNLRYDGLGAPKPSGSGNNLLDPASNSATPSLSGVERLEYLEKIVLFAKSDMTKPLKTVNFKYNYSLCKQLPNSADASNAKTGKLTLEKVWFEYNGAKPARISPYVFKYNYPNTSATVDAPLYNQGIDWKDELTENPNYKPYALDRWGYYQYDGLNRFTNLQEWNYQGERDPALKYDPAAWNLKQIILPSGGEIHVLYEEKDYLYVQDKKALAMVSLTSESDDVYSAALGNKYYLNLEDLDIESADVAEYHAMLEDEMEGKYVYFKFLYALKGASPRITDPSYKSEYIDGFVTVDDVVLDGTKIYLVLGEPINPQDIREGNFSSLYSGGTNLALPKRICFDYITANKGGVLDESGAVPGFMATFEDVVYDYYQEHATYFTADNTSQGVSSSYEYLGINTTNKGSATWRDDRGFAPFGKRDREYAGGTYQKGRRGEMRDLVTQDVPDNLYTYGTTFMMPEFAGLPTGEYCKHVDFSKSYLRLPVYKRKYGGGVRVKKLVYYDRGMESNESGSVFGQEYIYTDNKGYSTGVATNEPAAGKEENALVNVVDRYKQSLLQKLVAGRYKNDFVGPIGESIMPSPSVGYSRVIARNINIDNTGSDANSSTTGGFQVFDFYTAKDYPFVSDYTFRTGDEVEETNGKKAIDYSNVRENRKRDLLPLNLSMININIKKEWAAQGYDFIMYNRHGMPKYTATFAGQYEPDNATRNLETYPLISFEKNEYYEPGEKIKVLMPNLTYAEVVPGKVVDIAVEQKQVEEFGSNFSLPIDLGVVYNGIAVNFYLNFELAYSMNNSLIGTHVTSRVTNYPVINKGVIKMSDGVVTHQENLAFDIYTGKPVLTRNNESFTNAADLPSGGGDKHYYLLSIPASLHSDMDEYKPLGTTSDSKNILTERYASISTYGVNPVVVSSSPTNADPTHASNIQSSSYVLANTLNVLSAEYKRYVDVDIDPSGTTYTRTLPAYNYKLNGTRVYDQTEMASTHNTGYFSPQFDMALPKGTSVPTGTGYNWINTSEVTKWSINTEGLEERDALGNYSAVLNNSTTGQPDMIARNARYADIYYNSYETSGGTTGSSVAAHSGAYYLNTNTFSTSLTTSATQDYIIMYWAKGATTSQVKINSGSLTNASAVATTGEWTLYQYTFSAVTAGSNTFEISCSSGTKLDDIRIQPAASSAVCYVYDKQQRLLTTFDDQHFGLYYEYNQEGQLIRKRVETERGMMTVKETQYNTPKQAR